MPFVSIEAGCNGDTHTAPTLTNTPEFFDAKTGERFALDAAPDRALDVCYDPFSSAASRPAPRAKVLLAA